jgi:hypothetical protein
VYSIIVLTLAALRFALPPSQCSLREANRLVHRFEGGCGRLFGQEPRMKLKRARAIDSGRWRNDSTPVAVWAGTMSDSGYNDAELELEVYGGAVGILRTAYGWYPVRSVAASDSTLTFNVDTTAEVSPSPLDIEIIRRANALLSSNAVWNRADNRRCPGAGKTWSIYCALDRAAIDATCGTHHRRPAMETVRVIVDERTASRNYAHRLMDYNNDSSTTLSDVHSLFQEALRRMKASDGTAPGPPAVCPRLPEAAPEAADTMIVSRAAQLISTLNVWSRQDSDTGTDSGRPRSASNFSIRCALRQASYDVTGEYGGDGVLMRTARQLIDSLPHRKYDARLIDYNNDPVRTLDDVREYFRLLKAILAKRME